MVTMLATKKKISAPKAQPTPAATPTPTPAEQHQIEVQQKLDAQGKMSGTNPGQASRSPAFQVEGGVQGPPPGTTLEKMKGMPQMSAMDLKKAAAKDAVSPDELNIDNKDFAGVPDKDMTDSNPPVPRQPYGTKGMDIPAKLDYNSLGNMKKKKQIGAPK